MSKITSNSKSNNSAATPTGSRSSATGTAATAAAAAPAHNSKKPTATRKNTDDSSSSSQTAAALDKIRTGQFYEASQLIRAVINRNKLRRSVDKSVRLCLLFADELLKNQQYDLAASVGIMMINIFNDFDIPVNDARIQSVLEIFTPTPPGTVSGAGTVPGTVSGPGTVLGTVSETGTIPETVAGTVTVPGTVAGGPEESSNENRNQFIELAIEWCKASATKLIHHQQQQEQQEQQEKQELQEQQKQQEQEQSSKQNSDDSSDDVIIISNDNDSSSSINNKDSYKENEETETEVETEEKECGRSRSNSREHNMNNISNSNTNNNSDRNINNNSYLSRSGGCCNDSNNVSVELLKSYLVKLHHAAGVSYQKQKMFGMSQNHLVLCGRVDSLACLVKEWQTYAYPSERDLIVLRLVLMLLCNGDTEVAGELLASPTLNIDFDASIVSPVLQFSYLLIEACRANNADFFDTLRKKYALVIRRDEATFKRILECIDCRVFKREATSSNSGGILGLFNSLLSGGD